MPVLLAILLSPLIMVAVTLLAVICAKLLSLPKPGIGSLVGHTLLYAAIGAVASLAYTIAWMVWYEASSGYSAGNGPLGWIFFYGPLSAALGQLVALLRWWFRKRPDNSTHPTSQGGPA